MFQNFNLPLVKGDFFCSYTPMHEVTPKVVAMAVSTVMTMFRIFCQRDLFMTIDV